MQIPVDRVIAEQRACAETLTTLPKPYYQEPGITIYHADCRDVLPLLPKVDLVLTDPPYGVGMKYGEGQYDDSPEIYWSWFLPILEALKTITSVIFTHRQESLRWIRDWDHLCIWSKPMALGYAINGWIAHWEPIFVFGARPTIRHGAGKPAQYDVFTFSTIPNTSGHPCPKPIRLILALLETFMAGLILDPFMGSGTTLVAAKQLGLSAIGIEIEEKYCALAVDRLRQEVLPLTVVEDQPEQTTLFDTPGE